MTAFTIFDEDTGKIILDGDCPDAFLPMQQSHVVGKYDGKLKYVNPTNFTGLYDREVLDRPEMQTTLVGLDLTDIPLDSIEPMKLEIKSSGKSDVYDVAGESAVELSFPFPGKYVIRLFGFPYIDKTWEVNV